MGITVHTLRQSFLEGIQGFALLFYMYKKSKSVVQQSVFQARKLFVFCLECSCFAKVYILVFEYLVSIDMKKILERAADVYVHKLSDSA